MDGIRRIILEQIDSVLDRLSTHIEDQDETIHDARRRFKRVRSVLRLVRYEIGKKNNCRENLCYRDAGRRLSALRNGAVVGQTLEKVIRQFSDQIAVDYLSDFRRALASSSALRLRVEGKVISEVAVSIRAARRRVTKWPVKGGNFSSLRVGLKDTYRRGRRSYATTVADPRAENFHEWRKEVCYLRNQVRILRPIQPDALDRLLKELRELEDCLSENHDLDVLRRWFIAVIEKSHDQLHPEPLLALISERQMELQSMSIPMGERIYLEGPEAFVRRFERYWKKWRSQNSR